MQTDPVGYKSDVDLYAYAAEDPTNRSDPNGRTPCPGFTRDQCVEADEGKGKYDRARSNHQTTVNSPEMDDAMKANMGQVAVKEGETKEKAGFIVKDGKGGFAYQSPTGARTESWVNSDSVRLPSTPEGAVSVIHGHIPGEDGSLVSVTGEGDAQPLTQGLTNGVVLHPRLGVWEIKDGRVRFRMIAGRMSVSRGSNDTDSEATEMQDRVNQAQPYFYAPPPQ